MSYRKICELEDLWEGEMDSFDVGGVEVLLVSPEGGEIYAFQATCPHQMIALADGHFDGVRITCKAHQWMFDARTGKGINPTGCRLASYPVKIEGNDVFVDTEGVEPFYADQSLSEMKSQTNNVR